MSFTRKLKSWARLAKVEVLTVYFAARDPRTPLAVRVLALVVAAYALSPIDLIPDFIPVLGYLDDLLLVPLGLWLVVRLLPKDVLDASRTKARQSIQRPRSFGAAFIVVAIWVGAIGAGLYWLAKPSSVPRLLDRGTPPQPEAQNLARSVKLAKRGSP